MALNKNTTPSQKLLNFLVIACALLITCKNITANYAIAREDRANINNIFVQIMYANHLTTALFLQIIHSLPTKTASKFSQFYNIIGYEDNKSSNKLPIEDDEDSEESDDDDDDEDNPYYREIDENGKKKRSKRKIKK